MGDYPAALVHRTLRGIGVNPYPSTRVDRAVRQGLGTAAAATLAVAMTLYAIAAAFAGDAQSGVSAEEPGGSITAASPTGYGWRQGLRTGQTVLTLRRADEPGGWAVDARNVDGMIVSVTAEPYDQALRGSAPITILALAAGVVAILTRRTSSKSSLLASSMALLLASQTLTIQGDPLISTVSLALSTVVPLVWLASRKSDRTTTVPLLALMTLGLVLWGYDRFTAAIGATNLEAVRSLVTFGALGAVMAWSVVRPWLRGDRPTIRVTAADLLLAAGVLAGCVALATILHVPVVLIALGLVAVITVYPAWRSRAAREAEHLLLADLRERAAVDAMEQERARVASDLHDAPIQELSGVIQRLELIPDASEERATLREVAQQLRSVVTGLRPPMLDDLGLGPALEHLQDRFDSPNTSVRVTVDDRPGRAHRPPAAVELAAFRIAEEAVRNAVTHADAEIVTITGTVAADAINMTIEDNGVGWNEPPGGVPSEDGHVGLATMRRRASAIGADLQISANGGVAVAFRWHQ